MEIDNKFRVNQIKKGQVFQSEQVEGTSDHRSDCGEYKVMAFSGSRVLLFNRGSGIFQIEDIEELMRSGQVGSSRLLPNS